MTIHDAERALEEFRLVVDECRDLIAEGAVGETLDDTLKHAHELLDIVEAESVGHDDVQSALEALREELAMREEIARGGRIARDSRD